MNTLNFPVWLALLIPTVVPAQQTAATPQVFAIAPRTMDEESLKQLDESITVAAPEDIFSVEMAFDRPVPLEELRDAARRLRIPRVLALVEFFPTGASGHSSKAPVGVGTLYEDAAAWQRETCRAGIFASLSGTNELESTPPERWSIRNFHIYGSADAVREFRAGTVLPPARIAGGMVQQLRHLQALSEATRLDLARKIPVPANFTVATACRPFVGAIEAPVLSGQSVIPDIDSSQWERIDRTNSRPQLDRLAARAPTTPVTVQLVFRVEATVEMLASLVERYRIDGLVADLMPGNGDGRMLLQAEFSVHGAPLADQRRRVRCHIGLADAERTALASIALSDASAMVIDATDEWYARVAQISTQAGTAWKIAANEDLQHVQLTAGFAPGELARLEDYHRRKTAEPIRVARVRGLPEGCERFIQRQLFLLCHAETESGQRVKVMTAFLLNRSMLAVFDVVPASAASLLLRCIAYQATWWPAKPGCRSNSGMDAHRHARFDCAT